MESENSVNICPHCERPAISQGEQICRYCGRDIGQPNVQNVSIPIAPPELNIVNCWYCYSPNRSSQIRCIECGANLLAVSSILDEENAEERFVRRLDSAGREKCIIKGLKVVVESIMKKKRWTLLPCKKCSARYRFDLFSCPSCGAPSLLQDIRGVIYGALHDKTLIKELQSLFPRFDVLTYTNSAMMDHQTIAASKTDLEDAARQTSSMLETIAEYLKSVTYSYSKKQKFSGAAQGASSVFDFSGVNTAPDARVLELFESGSLRGNNNPGQQPNQQQGAQQEAVRNWSDI